MASPTTEHLTMSLPALDRLEYTRDFYSACDVALCNDIRDDALGAFDSRCGAA